MVYACSDIHGRYDRYIKAVNKLNKEDKLYIIGDVIDRNEGGVKVLQDILHRDNVELLLGNHENMMYTALVDNDDYWLDVWRCMQNGGMVTYQHMMWLYNDNPDEYYAILDMIKDCYLYKTIKVGNKYFYLSHGRALLYKDSPDSLKMSDADGVIIGKIVWDSPFRDRYGMTVYKNHKDMTFIHGHVMIQNMLDEVHSYRERNIVDIDGGCAFSKDNANEPDNALIMYCLDTGEEEYIR